MSDTNSDQATTSTSAKPPMSAVKRISIAILTGIVAVMAIVGIGTFVMQDRILYPGAGPHAAAQPGWTEIKMQVAGYGAVSAYSLPAKPGKQTVLFIHGNATGYEQSVKATAGFAARGMGVFVPEWPGYGGNPGHTSGDAIDATADAALYRLGADGVKPDDIVIYGNSIGTGPAIHAAVRPHGRLLIVSGVASIPTLVNNIYPFVPAALINDQRDNTIEIAKVKGKITVIHAADDQVVPFAQGQALAKAAKTQIVQLPFGGHGLAFDRGLQDALAVSFER